ncbi:MAG: nucleoside hydrolase [Planctomycetes bacterium]|nr:nucleoside hydrolase [Planctomycetota bacterium]
MAGRPLPILIDTDIGDDIDDALALALALTSPEVDLRAVTTVYGDVATRTRLALKLLATYGRPDVPVGTGRGAPLMGTLPTHVPNQAVVLEEGERLPEPSGHPADELIRRTAHEAAGRLVIITVGAMTNMALALLRDPRLARQARLVVMGGVVGRQQAEWNIRCDPEAARICFESGIPITLVGLDVTMKCQMSETDVEALAAHGSAATNLLDAMVAAWSGEKVSHLHLAHGRHVRNEDVTPQRKRKCPILHDPLAVAVAFRPELVTMQPRKVVVETRGEFTRAYTVATPSDQPNAAVCLDVDSAAFLRLFMGRLLSR